MQYFKKMLFVLDNEINEYSASLMRAIDLAKSNQADLTLLRVLPDVSSFFKVNKVSISEQDLRKKAFEKENTRLQQLVSSLNVDFSLKVELITGKRYIEAIRMVQANGFDLVIKEADNIDWLDHLFGSDDMHLLRKCPCPVWIMKKDDKPEYRNIMAAVDFGDEVEPCTNELNLRILERASSLSMAELTTLHVVNAYDVPLAGFVSQWVEQPEKVKKNLYEAEHVKRQIQLDALMADLKQKIGTESYNYVAPRPLLVQGPPGRELPKLADNLKIDLVVMGTVARSGIAGVIIGNTAETVLSQLQCSVLAIKPKGFISPIS